MSNSKKGVCGPDRLGLTITAPTKPCQPPVTPHLYPSVLHWNSKSLLAFPGCILLTGHLDSGSKQCKRKRGQGVGGTRLQTHISHRLLGPSAHTHTKRLKPNDPSSPLLWLLTSSFLLDKRLLAPHSTVLTTTHTHTHTILSNTDTLDRMGCLFCFLRRLGKKGRAGEKRTTDKKCWG